MKKVLFFRPTLSEGGADRVTTVVLRGLDRTRYRPTLVLLRKEGPFVSDLPSDVEVIELGAPRLALSLPSLARVLHRERPDIVFSTCSASNVLASLAHGLVRSNARLILSERNALYRGRQRTHLKQATEVALKRLTYGRADVVTAVSQGVADQLAEIGVRRDRIAVVYNPIVGPELDDLAGHPVDHPWFREGQPPVVLACARLVPQKDYPTVLDAFVRIRRSVDCRLFVLGNGHLHDELVARAARLGLADDVHFAGFDKNPFKYMARSHVLIHASRAEGLPGTLIQTMACGTPVVSTDCDFGPREVISSREDGYLVPVGDAAALAEHAIRILTDDAHREELSKAARASARRFSVSSSLDRYHRALEQP